MLTWAQEVNEMTCLEGGASIQLDRQCVVLKPVYQKT